MDRNQETYDRWDALCISGSGFCDKRTIRGCDRAMGCTIRLGWHGRISHCCSIIVIVICQASEEFR
jgi:hypothetical protein